MRLYGVLSSDDEGFSDGDGDEGVEGLSIKLYIKYPSSGFGDGSMKTISSCLRLAIAFSSFLGADVSPLV